MFYDNLKAICDEKGIKITPLVAECGGAKGSISNWKKGAMPNSEIVMKLSVRLNVPTDRLLFGSETKNASISNISNSTIGAVGYQYPHPFRVSTKYSPYHAGQS